MPPSETEKKPLGPYSIQINEHQRQLLIQAIDAACRGDFGEPSALVDLSHIGSMLDELPAQSSHHVLHGFCL